MGKTPKIRYEASPINFVHSKAPYPVFVYGSGDFYVDSQQHTLMTEKLKKYGVNYEIIFRKYYAHTAFLAPTDVYDGTLLECLYLAQTKF